MIDQSEVTVGLRGERIFAWLYTGKQDGVVEQ
jgi:hypothetical protein